MLKGFKEFILRGNVLDLAVAVVIGAAFNAVVSAVVENIINPVIGMLFNASSLSHTLVLHVLGADIKFGAFIAALINFLIVAVVVYFVFVLPVNTFKKRVDARKAEGTAAPEESVPTELDLLTEIRDLLAKGPAEEAAGKHQAGEASAS
ncbi:large conductance mechanosensitive channel protein MscL [Microbacterium sp. STN6]|uniref:large conductance mechanosensitive channel protein MscL n=1 Tax=Microbacterium sp. STN6 TaxID=2995588 RepID=UPI002260E901|nr:large conductance mechanosensitive channel protein MscL [Microbacterium sp. STN6]MCX7523457.1 large conductance mechanosensitive channel protein MscL [Microbacterium sp. STN6]